MTVKNWAAAACFVLPLAMAGGAHAQMPTQNVDCELGLRYVSEQVGRLTNTAVKADVDKLYRDAQVGQKANDSKMCLEKLRLAYHRANWTPGPSGGAGDSRTSSETPQNEARLFSAIDTNNDRTITRDEYMSYRNSRFDERSGRTRAQHDANTRDMFARRDANNDGIISAAEFDRGLRRG